MNRKLHRSIARAALAPALLLGALGLGARAAEAPPATPALAPETAAAAPAAKLETESTPGQLQSVQ